MQWGWILPTAVALGVGLTSCGSSSNTTSSPTSSSSAAPEMTASVSPSAAAPTTAADTPGAGPTGLLPAYTPPAPDAERNRPCNAMAVNWTEFEVDAGSPRGVRVVLQKSTAQSPWPEVSLPDNYTAAVQTTDGRHVTQDAYITHDATGPWDSIAEFDFLFRDLNPADVKEVLLTNSKGTCWVKGDVD